MTTPEKQIVARMFEAFAAKSVDEAVATVTDDSVWVHHGSQKLASIRFEGRSAVAKFFETNFATMDFEYFDVLRTLQDEETVIVFGREKFEVIETAEVKAQKWIQIYTIRDGLIARMEEFATSSADDEYIVIDF